MKASTSNWARRAEAWRTMPLSSTAFFLAGVFCLFGSFGFLISGMQPVQISLGQTGIMVLISGTFAMAYAFAGTRRILWMLALSVPLQVLANVTFGRLATSSQSLLNDPQGLAHKLVITNLGAVIMVAAGYTLFLIFFAREGSRFFKAHTEIRLASEIHQSLVPTISRRIGEYEFFGISRPSGEVGGDLVDLIETDSHWCGYVADVAGHGVSAGVLMAMVKSSVRTRMAPGQTETDLLQSLNRVVHSLTPSNIFVTCAYVQTNRDPGDAGTLAFSLAGHLPILHFSAADGRVQEHSVSNVPLGILPEAQFATGNIACAPGDLIAIVTDGFTEVFNRQQQELGMEGLKQMLQAVGRNPLPAIFQQIQSDVAAYGKQDDDQTVLLIRRDILSS